jgi:drug/metabolite transporter (DMT)-like permease
VLAERSHPTAREPACDHPTMLAIACGLATACLWAVTTLASARASRLIGPAPTLALVMLLGLLVAVPAIALTGPLPALGPAEVGWLALAGFGNVFGLLLQYRGFQTGQVGVVATIISTEGAIVALLAIALGEPVVGGVIVALAIVATGAALASSRPAVVGGDTGSRPSPTPGAARRATVYAAAAAGIFGLSLYAVGRVGAELPIAWAVLPARLAGTVVITLPLGFRGGLRTDRAAMPAVVLTAIAEVAGVVVFALGARTSIAVTAVLASQFAVVSAVAALVLFREQLAPRQWVGVATTAVGVALLGALQM